MNKQLENWDVFCADVREYIQKTHLNPEYLRADLFTCFAYKNKNRPRRMLRNYMKIAYITMMLYMQIKEEIDET